jgi:hypothetical protein
MKIPAKSETRVSFQSQRFLSKKKMKNRRCIGIACGESEKTAGGCCIASTGLHSELRVLNLVPQSKKASTDLTSR